VGFLLIFFFSGLVLAEPHASVTERPDALKEISSDLRQHKNNTNLGQLKIGKETIIFPWAMRYIPDIYSPHSSSVSPSLPKKNYIIMNSTNSTAIVQDLSAINSANVRDLLYNDSQNGDPRYHGVFNTVGISVSGNGKDAVDGWALNGQKNKYLEQLRDKASRLGVPQRNATAEDQKFSSEKRDPYGNYLGIDVRGISVSAINTMDGGSAVATSNIIINPVQIIDLAPEVEEKLR
jgi:hypothetical protein